MNRRDRLLEPRTWFAHLTSDAGLAVVFFAASVVSRIPFRSRFLYHWDSVNFALGMEQFNVRLHQPHPPGYLLYVLLGRLVDSFVGDANASLVWISVVSGGLTVSMVYLLGRRLFGQAEAIIGALLALTGPAFWFYGEVALTYTIEAFFVTVIAFICLETLHGNWHAALLSALLLGLAGGIRQTTLILMLPLWLFSLRRCRWWVIVVAVFLLGLTISGWLVPTILLSGGLESYLKASRSIGGGVLSDFELFNEGRFLYRLSPFVRLGTYLGYGLMLGLVPLLYGVIRCLGKAKFWLGQWRSNNRVHVMALWLIPNLVLYAPLVRVPGHTFSFMPALVLISAATLVMLGHDLANWLSSSATWSILLLTSLVLIVNVACFLAAPPYLFGVRRVVATTPSWPTIRYRDQYVAERVAYISQHFDASSTVILTTGPDYRHPDYYLRGYHSLRCGDELLTSDVPAGSQVLVFLSDMLSSHQGNVGMVALPSGEPLFYLQLDANSEVVVDELEVFVRACVQ
jgi:hypothetical protein